MKIKEIVSQNRRDFRATYVCEHCGNEREGGGYDDDNFHRNVVPAMKCSECGKTAPTDYKPLGTKHPEWKVI